MSRPIEAGQGQANHGMHAVQIEYDRRDHASPGSSGPWWRRGTHHGPFGIKILNLPP